jgi:DnaJ family protein C protein 3
VGLLKKYRERLQEDIASVEPPLPSKIDPTKRSPRLAGLLKDLCRVYVDLKLVRKGEKYCDEVLGMVGYGEDVDALVGKGEAALVREEWEEGVRFLQKAFEASGNSDGNVGFMQRPGCGRC